MANQASKSHEFTREMKSLIIGLYEDQTVNKELGDDIEKRRKQVKDYLNEHKLLGSFLVGDVRLSYSESTRSSTDEDMMIEIIKKEIARDDLSEEAKAALRRCIVKKEVIDEPALSDALYGEIITTKVLEPAVHSSTSTVLKLSRKVLKDADQ